VLGGDLGCCLDALAHSTWQAPAKK
jgi:hypothetical protein